MGSQENADVIRQIRKVIEDLEELRSAMRLEDTTLGHPELLSQLRRVIDELEEVRREREKHATDWSERASEIMHKTERLVIQGVGLTSALFAGMHLVSTEAAQTFHPNEAPAPTSEQRPDRRLQIPAVDWMRGEPRIDQGRQPDPDEVLRLLQQRESIARRTLGDELYEMLTVSLRYQCLAPFLIPPTTQSP